MTIKIQNTTIFIDDKTIKDAKISFSSTTNDIILPHYTIDDDLDESGENRIYLLMSHGHTTLKSLQETAIKERNERKQA